MHTLNWSFAMSDDFPLDRRTYLIASILHLAYVYVDDYGDKFIAVDLSEIRKLTKNASQGCTFLVEEGLAKWIEVADRRDPTQTPRSISIGTTTNFIDAKYYFDEIIVTSMKPTRGFATDKIVHKRKAGATKLYDFSDVMDDAMEHLNTYRAYCTRISRNAMYATVSGTLKKVLDDAETGKLAPNDLIDYLDSYNAIVNQRTSMEGGKKASVKVRSVAKSLLEKHNIERIIRLVPYFVLNYPNIADPRYMDTNIFMLNMKFDAMQLMMQRDNLTKPTKKKYGDDNDEL